MNTNTNHIKIPKPRLISPRDRDTSILPTQTPIHYDDTAILNNTNSKEKKNNSECENQDTLAMDSTLQFNTPFKRPKVTTRMDTNDSPFKLEMSDEPKLRDIERSRERDIHGIGVFFSRPIQSNYNETSATDNNAIIKQENIGKDLVFSDSEIPKRFDNLLEILYTIFTSTTTNSDKKMLLPEYYILNAILYKKFLKCFNGEISDLSLKSIERKLQPIISFSTSKRPEECYKYILYKVVKYLKTKFRYQFKLQRVQLEKFYEYYFGETAKKFNMPLEAFYFPNKSKKLAKNTLNSRYFSLIFKSNKFTTAVYSYIQQELIEDHYKIVTTKLNQFIKKLHQSIADCKFSNWLDTSSLANGLFKSGQLKLPWTLSEVQEAALRVTELIEEHR